ncbi:hypothetical protein [Oceanobacillus sp. 1P07AA]
MLPVIILTIIFIIIVFLALTVALKDEANYQRDKKQNQKTKQNNIP